MKVLFLFPHIQSSFYRIIVIGIVISFVRVSPAVGQDHTQDMSEMIFIEMDSVSKEATDSTDVGFNLDGEEFNNKSLNELDEEENVPSFWTSYIFNPMRLGIKYELVYKVAKPDRIMNNRLSYRLEYSKSFFNHFSLHIDTKAFTFLKNDHRARKTTFWFNDRPKEADISFGGRTREAYLQTSFLKTSIKAGIQVVVWGESDFATVTNEISRLDYREPLSLNVDELRIGQPMLTIDQYSPFGDWSGFFTPYPQFNEHAKKGTGYYADPFNGSVEYQMETQDESLFEYGLRWKKTFGKSDVSVMAASLINNEYALHMISPDVINRSKSRFHMAGLTFNRAVQKFVVRGEVAIKFPKPFNNSAFQIVKKNALDASLGFDYSPSSTLTLSMEAVNYHVMDWNEEILGVPKHNYMVLLVVGKQLMNNDLSINWVGMYNGPYTNFFNVLTTYYNWNDHLTFYLDILVPITNNPSSGLYFYRDQKQVSFKIEYQF